MSPRSLERVSAAFFYGYLGLCVVAGTGGAVVGRRDLRLVAGFDPRDPLDAGTVAA